MGSEGHIPIDHEMERSGNPLEAKRRMGLTNKTDKLDAGGTGNPAAQRYSPRGVDSPERVARSARAAAAADIFGETAHSRKESNPRNVISS
jgi:hypothetical protein